MIKAALLDLDDTLINSQTSELVAAYLGALARYSAPVVRPIRLLKGSSARTWLR